MSSLAEAKAGNPWFSWQYVQDNAETIRAALIEHVKFNSKVLDGSDGASFSGNPNSWRTDTKEMFTGHKGRQKIVTPWR